MGDESQEIFEKIEEYRDDVIEFQKTMTAVPAMAPENGGDGETKKAVALRLYLKSKGFPQPKHFDAPDTRVTAGSRPNILYKIEGKDSSRTVYIMSHLDVVPEGERSLWKSDPFELKVVGDRIFGRGVEDNQHGMTASVMAAKALIDLELKPKYDVGLLFVSDEEVGSKYGVEFLLKHHNIFKKDDLIIVPDAGDPNGKAIEIAEKSISWLKIETTGQQCHASRPDQGNNAFFAASKLAVKIHDLYKVFSKKDRLFTPPTSTFEPTKKEANVPNVNTIPGEDVFWVDCRVLPDYDLARVEAQIRDWADKIEESDRVKIKIGHGQRAQAAPPTAKDAPVVKALSKAIKKVYNVNAKPYGIGGGTVAALIRRKGYPAAVWSRIYETAHQPNEYTDISNILGDAKIFAHVFMNG
jgi:succinyl-diaminopimelate desuccinylase